MRALLYQIREATPDDAQVIVEFNRRLAWETEHKRLDPALIGPGVAEALRRRELARYFVAVRAGGTPNEGGRAGGAGDIIGQMMITYEWSDWRNGLFWWIQSVYVRDDARREGVFRGLYEHVRTLARRTPGTCGLRLYVEHENAAALATYVKLGMKPSGHLVYEVDWS
jgi:GNAT superfamily N-acetyltransferase